MPQNFGSYWAMSLDDIKEDYQQIPKVLTFRERFHQKA